MSTDDPLMLLPFAAGRVTALPASMVLAGEEQAARILGTHQAKDPLNAGTEKLLDSKALGDLLGCDSTTVEGLVKCGKLPCVRVGRLLRFEAAVCVAALRGSDRRL